MSLSFIPGVSTKFQTITPEKVAEYNSQLTDAISGINLTVSSGEDFLSIVNQVFVAATLKCCGNAHVVGALLSDGESESTNSQRALIHPNILSRHARDHTATMAKRVDDILKDFPDGEGVIDLEVFYLPVSNVWPSPETADEVIIEDAIVDFFTTHPDAAEVYQIEFYRHVSGLNGITFNYYTESSSEEIPDFGFSYPLNPYASCENCKAYGLLPVKRDIPIGGGLVSNYPGNGKGMCANHLIIVSVLSVY